MDTRSLLRDAMERRDYCYNDGEHEALPEIDNEIASLQEQRQREIASLERLQEQVARALAAAHHAEEGFAELTSPDDDRAERLTMTLAEADALVREILADA